jgi:hypothetical protein
MNIYRYVIVTDNGLAPCIDNGLLTLCVCKPLIRLSAKEGDWVIAFGSKRTFGPDRKLVYAAEITKKCTMIENITLGKNRLDSLYQLKNGQLQHNGSKYHKEDSNQRRDLKGMFCLISEKFWYFGSKAMPLPFEHDDLYFSGRGHTKKPIKAEKFINFLTFLQTYPQGVIGMPLTYQSYEDHQ